MSRTSKDSRKSQLTSFIYTQFPVHRRMLFNQMFCLTPTKVTKSPVRGIWGFTHSREILLSVNFKGAITRHLEWPCLPLAEFSLWLASHANRIVGLIQDVVIPNYQICVPTTLISYRKKKKLLTRLPCSSDWLWTHHIAADSLECCLHLLTSTLPTGLHLRPPHPIF